MINFFLHTFDAERSTGKYGGTIEKGMPCAGSWKVKKGEGKTINTQIILLSIHQKYDI